jgi:putative ABC transport system ATP-binding protein
MSAVGSYTLAAVAPIVVQAPAIGIDPAIRCRQVTKEFGTDDAKIQVLHGIDLELPPGEMALLVGPSGCGKTTLISIIAGLLDPTAGSVDVFGSNITDMRGREKVRFRGANIGFVFQQYNLLPALTAVENAAVPLLIQGWKRRQAIDKAAEMLEEVGIGHKRNSLPNQLSGGQQQRVAIARALVHEPRLLVCDEPTAALDASLGQVVLELLRKIAVQPDRGVIVVTHDSRIYGFGDRMVTMSDGRIDKILTDRSEFAH